MLIFPAIVVAVCSGRRVREMMITATIPSSRTPTAVSTTAKMIFIFVK